MTNLVHARLSLPARVQAAVLAEAESYRLRNLTPVFRLLSTGPNQALVKRILGAGPDDPVWVEFQTRMHNRHRDLGQFNSLEMRAAVLSVWNDVQDWNKHEHEMLVLSHGGV
jgi:hypothetical protein